MKIAYVTDVLYPHVKGGCEKRIWEVSRRLVGRGHEVHIYCMKYWEGDDVVEREGVVLHGVCKPARLYTPSGRRTIWEAVYFSLKLLPPLLRGDYDVVDCNQFPFLPLFVSKLCCMLKGKRLYSTWHEVWGREYWIRYLGPLGVFGWIIEKTTAKLPEKIITVSKNTREAVASLGVAEEKIALIPNGIDLERIEKIKPSTHTSDIIFAGRLIPDKNVDVLIKAVALLDTPVKCLIVGDGPEKQNLKKLATKLGISNQINFKGFLEYDKLIAHMKSSKIFVLPSTREGFGLTIIEANASGIPVIAVKHKKSAAAELIEKGVVGVTCTLSANDLTEKIDSVLSGEKKFDFKTSSEVLKSYDWGNIVEEVESNFSSAQVFKDENSVPAV